MKIKIEFTVPSYEAMQIFTPEGSDAQVIFIQDPYIIIMEEGGRHIVNNDRVAITYEKYCFELQHIIERIIRSAKLEKAENCSGIIIVGCKEPPNFKSLCTALANANLSISPQCQLIFKDCSFNGSLYVDSVTNLVKTFSQKDPRTFFNIIIDEQAQSKLSAHDEAKLAALNNVLLFNNNGVVAAKRRFIDDQLVGGNEKIVPPRKAKDDSQLPSKSSPFLNPSYFLKSKMAQKPLPENILMHFFSQRHQQQSDYTCGPSALKMVADYYVSMVRRTFSGELIQQQAALKLLNSSTESEVSERVKTTEAVGSEIADMRNGLMALRLSVFDDCDGLSFSESSEQELYSHKAILWEKMKEILKLGIPIIINMRDKDEIGHYEIAIGIDDENIILAEPGAALSGEIQFESIPKNVFINRWKNMSGELHGRYLIISPNKASTEAIESILQDVPHYRNGQSVNKSQPLHEKARLNF